MEYTNTLIYTHVYNIHFGDKREYSMNFARQGMVIIKSGSHILLLQYTDIPNVSAFCDIYKYI